MISFLDYQNEQNMGLFTDLYELTMCSSYFDNNRLEPATFDLFTRRLSATRSYLLFAGLEQVLLYLKGVHFTDEHIVYLKEQGFHADFLRYLTTLQLYQNLQRSCLKAQFELLEFRIGLYRALGSGWNLLPPPSPSGRDNETGDNHE